jgi:hypothetical protein
LADSVTPAERERFAAAAADLHAVHEAIAGILPVRKLARGHEAFLTDLWTTGTAKDLSALGWSLRRRIEFVVEVAQAIERLHAEGMVHGCLCPDNILLDDDLHPMLAEAGLVDTVALTQRRDGAIYEAYASPERKEGKPATPSGDVYSVGKVLQQISHDTMGAHPSPPALVEIVGRCLGPPMSRPASATELVASLKALLESLRQAEEMRAASPTAPRPQQGDARPRRETPALAFPVPGKAERPSAPWKPPLWLGLTGLALVVGAVAAAAFVGGTNDALRALLIVATPLGAALTTTLAPALPRAGSLGRFVLAAGVAGLVVAFDPLSFAFRLAAQAHLSGDPNARRQAIDEVLRLGRNFRGLSLAGANLAGVDMTGADLRGVNATGANLTGARLFAAEVEGTNFDGAQLAGADLTGTELQLANLGAARCDGSTRLPATFACNGERISRNQAPPAP